MVLNLWQFAQNVVRNDVSHNQLLAVLGKPCCADAAPSATMSAAREYLAAVERSTARAFLFGQPQVVPAEPLHFRAAVPALAADVRAALEEVNERGAAALTARATRDYVELRQDHPKYPLIVSIASSAP